MAQSIGAGMTGGAFQEGGTRGAEMDIRGERRGRHSGAHISALGAVASAGLCMAFQDARCDAGTRNSSGKRNLCLAGRTDRTIRRRSREVVAEVVPVLRAAAFAV